MEQYLAFCAATGRNLPPWPGNNGSWTGKSGWSDPLLQQHPIVDVAWFDAKAYADWAGVLLPTEAQWEYAARGEQGNNYPWGGTATVSDLHDGWDETICANSLNSADVGKSTWPVGSFSLGASWCGAQDMTGNAYEWCADYYDSYSSTPATNPTGPTLNFMNYRVLRGGAWAGYMNTNGAYRGAHRYYRPGGAVWDYIGFRCVSRPLSAVSLCAAPSLAKIGSPVLLTAAAKDGGILEYQFYRRVGTSWESLTGGKYLPAKSCSYTPTVTGSQLFRVNAREMGTTKYFPGEVTVPVNLPLSAVSLAAAPAVAVIGSPVLLTASATGGGTLEYQFYRRVGTSWESLTGGKYIPAKSCSYTPTVTGSQLFRVNAREVGTTKYFPGKVTVPVNLPLSAVSLAAAPAVAVIGSPVLLTASLTGGGTLEYQFYRRVGTSWESLTGGKYLPAKSCSYTPTVTGSQLFRVNAREVGTTKYFPGEVTVPVNLPLSAVSLAAAPAVAVIGSPVLLTASATGGGTLEYQFYRRVGTSWESLTGGKYLPAKSCSYTPTVSGSQLFRVNAREVGTTKYFPGEVTVNTGVE